MNITAPEEFKHWCRSCRVITWHYQDRAVYVCEMCNHEVLGAEMVLTYSTSETREGDRLRLLVPIRLLPERVRMRMANPKQPKTLRGREER